MDRLILHSAVITAPGTYSYEVIEPQRARAWLEAAPFTSAIGWTETARALGALTGFQINTGNAAVVMDAGEEALVFRIVFPPGVKLPPERMKGRLGITYITQHCEIGILRRLT